MQAVSGLSLDARLSLVLCLPGKVQQMSKMDPKNTLLYSLTVAILVLGLGVLIYLERRVALDRQSAIDNATELIGKERILRATDDIRISFSTIESLARSVKKNPFITDILVSKILAGRGEQVVFPFYYNALSESKRVDLESLRRIPFTDNGNTLGYLYLDLNNRIIIGVRVAVASFALLLLLTLLSFYLRVHAQERVISATTVELEEKRRELIRLERLALAGQLTANILHDIKKPMLNIKQEAQDLSDFTTHQQTRSVAASIHEQVELFFHILRDLGLERFVKATDNGEEYLDINEVLERSCRLVRYERGGVTLQNHLAPNLPLVFAHPYKLIQLFSNLILNAYQAMQGQGTLEVRTSSRASTIRIEIADTGPGISPDNIPRLFTPFFTTKGERTAGEEGTGLGLYISKNIVDELDGRINVKSKPGQGATFVITLPAAEKKPGFP